MQSNTLYILNMQRLNIYYNSRCELRVTLNKKKILKYTSTYTIYKTIN